MQKLTQAMRNDFRLLQMQAFSCLAQLNVSFRRRTLTLRLTSTAPFLRIHALEPSLSSHRALRYQLLQLLRHLRIPPPPAEMPYTRGAPLRRQPSSSGLDTSNLSSAVSVSFVLMHSPVQSDFCSRGQRVHLVRWPLSLRCSQRI